jgi:hypothetical protein
MPSVRARGQLLPILGIVVLVLFTLGNAAANLIPVHRPTLAEQREDERREYVEQWELRIAELRGTTGACHPAGAHELAKLLVMAGRWDEVRAFAGGYEQRCGADPVVHHWGEAPRPRSAR